jgi:hypothetical protein
MRLLAPILLFALCSCWARLPSTGPDSIHRLVGKTGTTTKTLYLFHNIDGTNAFTSEHFSSDTRDRLKSLPKGQPVKVRGVVSRLVPDGRHYYIVLTTLPDQKTVFDYPILGDGLADQSVFLWHN